MANTNTRAAMHADSFALEPLEKREVFDVTVNNALNDMVVNAASGSQTLSLIGRYSDTTVTQVARFITNHGNIDIALYNTLAPNTVANFLAYFNANFYNGTIFHRSQRPTATYPYALIQGGGFRTPTADYVSPPGTVVAANQPNAIPGSELSPPVTLEHPTGNAAYTLGVARSNDPNSGTSQFYINITDNTDVFDSAVNPPGYATFGTVLPLTRATVDTINGFTYYRADSAGFDPALTNLPLDLTGAGAGTVANPLTIEPGDYMNITGSQIITDLTGIETAQWSVSVVNNPSLVSVSLNHDGTLTITPNSAGTRGTATIRVTATSADGSVSVNDDFTFELANFAPSIRGMQAQSNVALGNTILLSAFGVRDHDAAGTGGIASVEFWFDADGDGQFNAANDTMLGADASSAAGWAARVSTAGMNAGANTIFARVTDTDGATAVTSRSVTLRPAVPSSDADPGTITVGPGQLVDVHFNSAIGQGDIRGIRIFIDSNNDGVLDPLTDRSIGNAFYCTVCSRWRFYVEGDELSSGVNRVFARVTDNYGNFGGITTSVITVAEP